MPSWEATTSDTMMPMMANVMEIFMPPKIYGNALGMRIFQKICQREPMKVRAMRWISSSIDSKPMAALIVIGKNATRKASSRLDMVPVPNHTMNKGAMEIFGVPRRDKDDGKKAFWKGGGEGNKQGDEDAADDGEQKSEQGQIKRGP